MIVMDDPTTWALDLLPVKRKIDGELFPEVGVLLPGRPVVFLVNVFAPRTLRNLTSAERIEYPDYDAVREDGWEID